MKIRRDYCKIIDCIWSCDHNNANTYYTGSKTKGLDLPGSDDDIMIDINKMADIVVSESTEDLVQSTRANKLLIVTDNVPPAFALLKCVNQSSSLPIINSDVTVYLSSQDVLSSLNSLPSATGTRRTQGPSLETWMEFEDTYEAGRDNVPSILCKGWPKAAEEWKDRPRHYA